MRLGPLLLPLLLPALLPALLLASCGDDARVSAESDPAPARDAWEQVALLTGTAAGGVVSEQATPLPDEAAVTAFAAGFDDGLGAEITDAASTGDLGEGRELYGAVVSIGCDVPPGVLVDLDGDQVAVRARPVKESRVECLAPVTTVALLSVAE